MSFYGIAALGLFGCLLTLGQPSLWFDEILTLQDLRLSFYEMVTRRAGAGHGPLYFATAWVWTRLTGEGEWALRLPSFACIAIGIGLLTQMVRETTKNELAAAVAAALLSLNGYLFYFAHLVRPYAMVLPFLALTLLGITRARHQPGKRHLALVAAGVAFMLLTHYSTLWVIVALAVYSLIVPERKRLIAAILAGAAVWAVFGVWAMQQSSPADRLSWWSAADWKSAAVYPTLYLLEDLNRIVSPWGPQGAVFAACSLMLLGLGLWGSRHFNRGGGALAAAWLAPLIGGVVLGLTADRDVFRVARYFVATIALFGVLLAPLIAMQLGRRPQHLKHWVGLGAVVGLFLVTLALYSHGLKNPRNASSYVEIVAHLEQHRDDDHPVLVIDRLQALPLEHYLGDEVVVLVASLDDRKTTEFDHVTPADLRLRGKPVWIKLTLEHATHYDAIRRGQERAWLSDMLEGLEEVQAIDFASGRLVQMRPITR